MALAVTCPPRARGLSAPPYLQIRSSDLVLFGVQVLASPRSSRGPALGKADITARSAPSWQLPRRTAQASSLGSATELGSSSDAKDDIMTYRNGLDSLLRPENS